jgi:Tol biopolymer transport system component
MKECTKSNAAENNLPMRISKCSFFYFFVICIIFFISGCGNEDARTIKEIETSGECEPAVSPDGGYIAYTKEGEDEIWLFEMATEESEYLTNGSLPDWSPDGKEIVFVKDRDIYKMDIETAEIQRLTTWGSCFFPDWSANGEFLAFDCTIGSMDSNGIWIMDLSNDNTNHLGLGREPDWHPLNNRLSYVGGVINVLFGEIFAVDTSGENVIRLTDNQVDDYCPVWSPDGSKIAYVSATHIENETPDYFVYNIWIMDTDGVNKTQLTSVSGRYNGAYDPAWTSNGTRIVYARGESFERENVIEVINHIWVMDADGGNKRQLTGKVIETFGCK